MLTKTTITVDFDLTLAGVEQTVMVSGEAILIEATQAVCIDHETKYRLTWPPGRQSP